ncbi:hypothetical protein D3C73_671400 [compost metagenome]
MRSDKSCAVCICRTRMLWQMRYSNSLIVERLDCGLQYILIYILVDCEVEGFKAPLYIVNVIFPFSCHGREVEPPASVP